MKILAVSGSARRESVNTALLRALSRAAPDDIEVSVYAEIGRLPVFSPDLEAEPPPDAVRDYIARVEAADGVIVSSPEYVRSLPGGLKNAVDWLVSRDTLATKPIALMHASHRGDDALAALRIVLATVSERFAPDIFLRFPLMKMTPAEVADFVAVPENAAQATAYLRAFADFCKSAGPGNA
jgi:chromate reductase, NAD(P)H dehydrogenase (quinone)